jgi:predicted metal-dependent enzyme (double-stranded beta helix superfamily)/catechol 2,3-dioxygenase-like lactoylglutathione lyase family enzyme
MRLLTDRMDALDRLLRSARDSMASGQTAVGDILAATLTDPERIGAAIRSRPKPWFFVADEIMTVFCTEGRPGNASAPHDHGTWSVLGCFAGSEESWWHEVDGVTGLRTVGSGVLRAGETHKLPADTIHAVMNRWTAANGIIHIYAGNFLAVDRHIWDPVTHERRPAGLSEPLATADGEASLGDDAHAADNDLPALGGTAFASLNVQDLDASAAWLTETLGLTSLTTHDDTCAIDERFRYLLDPASLTVIGLHATPDIGRGAELAHLALRVPSLAQLERWRDRLAGQGAHPSVITNWSFGTFVDVTGPGNLTIRLFVPAVR